MIKLNRTTEYGLIALRHMSQKRLTDAQGITSAREVSDVYGLPFEITAKTLQRLKDTGLIYSAQGARGGYTLHRALSDVSLAEFLELMEGPQSVVACASGSTPSEPVVTKSEPESDCSCAYSRKCEIKGVMGDLNRKVYEFLTGITLAEITVGASGNSSKTKEYYEVSNLS